jgi:uncharacterized protein DUF6522
MNAVTFLNGEFRVDAEIVAEGLGLSPAIVLAGMRQRRITSLCERGVDEDAGRYRLTFFYAQRRLRLVVDEAGIIIERLVESGRRRGSADGTGS